MVAVRKSQNYITSSTITLSLWFVASYSSHINSVWYTVNVTSCILYLRVSLLTYFVEIFTITIVCSEPFLHLKPIRLLYKSWKFPGLRWELNPHLYKVKLPSPWEHGGGKWGSWLYTSVLGAHCVHNIHHLAPKGLVAQLCRCGLDPN